MTPHLFRLRLLAAHGKAWLGGRDLPSGKLDDDLAAAVVVYDFELANIACDFLAHDDDGDDGVPSVPFFCMMLRNSTVTFEAGRIRTWRLPMLSALLMAFMASAKTLVRTMIAAVGGDRRVPVSVGGWLRQSDLCTCLRGRAEDRERERRHTWRVDVVGRRGEAYFG